MFDAEAEELLPTSEKRQDAPSSRHTTLIGCILSMITLSWLAVYLVLPSIGTFDQRPIQSSKYVDVSLGKHWHGWGSVRHLFVFGDSWSDTGFDPKGEQPSSANPLGNPDFPGRTSANGTNWVGLLTASYNSSPIMTVNYARSGAMIDPENVFQTGWPHFRLEILEKFASDNETWSADNALFAIWVGVNNIIFNTPDPPDRYAEDFDMYTGLMRFLEAAGARNFLVLNVPPLGRAPLAHTLEDEDEWASRVDEWNERLSQMLQEFHAEFAETTILSFDAYNLTSDVMDDPSMFAQTLNVEIVNSSCPAYMLGTPEWNTHDPDCDYSVDKYLWLNDFHPSTYLHDALAFEIANGL